MIFNFNFYFNLTLVVILGVTIANTLGDILADYFKKLINLFGKKVLFHLSKVDFELLLISPAPGRNDIMVHDNQIHYSAHPRGAGVDLIFSLKPKARFISLINFFTHDEKYRVQLVDLNNQLKLNVQKTPGAINIYELDRGHINFYEPQARTILTQFSENLKNYKIQINILYREKWYLKTFSITVDIVPNG